MTKYQIATLRAQIIEAESKAADLDWLNATSECLDEVERLQAELDRAKAAISAYQAALRDPVVVRMHIQRGDIAMPERKE